MPILKTYVFHRLDTINTFNRFQNRFESQAELDAFQGTPKLGVLHKGLWTGLTKTATGWVWGDAGSAAGSLAWAPAGEPLITTEGSRAILDLDVNGFTSKDGS